jgi:PKD repeat protein
MRQIEFKMMATSIFVMLTIQLGSSQDVKPGAQFEFVTNSGSPLQKSDDPIIDQATLRPDRWQVSLENFGPHEHVSSVPADELKKLREVAARNRSNGPETSLNFGDQSRTAVDAPVMTRSFRGNVRNGSVPMDNSMAISKNGFIVSGINTNLVFSQVDGDVRYTAPLADFFKILGLGTRLFDPRIIYDNEANRFIITCINGTDSISSALPIAFSQTEDPTGRWNYFVLDGNPLNDGQWSDYPNVAISKQDLFITTLLRDSNSDWKYSMVFQINKQDGYEGKPLSWKYYTDPKNADGSQAFNLVPAPSGAPTLLDQNMYFVSNENLGGDTYHLYQCTASVLNNPVIRSFQTKGLLTGLAPLGRQKNSAEMLNTFDSRIWSALQVGGTIHMGSHVNTPSGDVGLFYGRLDIETLKVDADVLRVAGEDFGFPSFTNFGNNPDDHRILVNYLYSGTDLFPSQGQRVVSGQGANFDWSDPVILKSGSKAISALSGNEERWGDYSTACRRYLANRNESWSVGMHGESGDYATWIGQFVDSASLGRPRADFTAQLTTTIKSSNIQYFDFTSDNATAWSWSFPGGTPATSTIKNPLVTYNADGAYDATLIVDTDKGKDTITKREFIHIQDPLLKPQANFSQDADTIIAGQSVNFMNTSIGEVVKLRWTFQNGLPATSTVANPTVKWSSPGSYIVGLTAENTAGSNSKIKQKAVIVKAASSISEEANIRANIYPNPVGHGSSLVTCDFELSERRPIVINIIDIEGRLITTLWNDYIKAGQNRLQFETTALAGGQYFIQFNDSNRTKSFPIQIIR